MSAREDRSAAQLLAQDRPEGKGKTEEELVKLVMGGLHLIERYESVLKRAKDQGADESDEEYVKLENEWKTLMQCTQVLMARLPNSVLMQIAMQKFKQPESAAQPE